MPADPGRGTGANSQKDLLHEHAALMLAGELAASVRAIRARLHVGQLRAQRLRAYLCHQDATSATTTAVGIGAATVVYSALT